MKKQRYIIVGDNNYWYATTGLIDEQGLKEEIERVRSEIKMGADMFSPQPGCAPVELYAYPISGEPVTAGAN